MNSEVNKSKRSVLCPVFIGPFKKQKVSQKALLKPTPIEQNNLDMTTLQKQCHIALIIMIINELLILALLVATINFVAANFVTPEKMLIK